MVFPLALLYEIGIIMVLLSERKKRKQSLPDAAGS
jgi:Sec-independent protein secretion pathway component TatC